MLTGNREILPISCSSRAGNEKSQSFASFTGVECFKRFKFVSHAVIVIRAKSRTSLATLLEDIQRFLDFAAFGMTDVHVISAPPASL